MNYPDDIRMYDSDPRSPFYVSNPDCPYCGEELGGERKGEYWCSCEEWQKNEEGV